LKAGKEKQRANKTMALLFGPLVSLLIVKEGKTNMVIPINFCLTPETRGCFWSKEFKN
jgi:hypothetical protein